MVRVVGSKPGASKKSFSVKSLLNIQSTCKTCERCKIEKFTFTRESRNLSTISKRCTRVVAKIIEGMNTLFG